MLYHIGSTCESLSRRKDRHRNSFKRYLNGKKEAKTSSFFLFEGYGVENCKIELIDIYPCGCKEELLRREGHYIKETDCLNKVVEGRTNKEYRQDNLERCGHWQKDWIEKNKESYTIWLKEYRQQYYTETGRRRYTRRRNGQKQTEKEETKIDELIIEKRKI